MRSPLLTKRLLAAAAIAMVYALSVNAESTEAVVEESGKLSAKRLERLTSAMQGYVDQGLLPGVVLLIEKDGDVAYEHAFGYRDIDSKAPMEKDTIFRIASQSKAIVSAGALILQEEGKLLITDPVGKYLPEWMSTTVAVKNDAGGYDIVPATRSITIRDLLTHTSGIPYGSWMNGIPASADEWTKAGINGWAFTGEQEPIREIARRMAALPMIAQPGEGWFYGNNTDVLGAVLEAAAGQPLDVLLKERVFDPIGMSDTQFYLPKDESGRLATVYDQTKDGLVRSPDGTAMWDQGQYIIGEGPNVAFSGGAGLLSTAPDYMAFLETIRNAGVAPNGTRVLAPMSVKLMTEDHLGGLANVAGPGGFLPKGAGFSYGFQVAEDPGTLGFPVNEGENFWGGAYHSIYWIDHEEEMVVTFFSQLGDTIGSDDQEKLRTLIYQAIE